MMHLRILAAVAALLLFFGCGGGSGTGPTPPSVAAKSLSYTEPTGTGWRLMKGEGSTSTRLLLNVTGPAGTLARGVALTLQAPTDKVIYAPIGESYIKNFGIFDLYHSSSAEVPLLMGGVNQNQQLMLGIFQKGASQSAKDCGRPLFQFALELKDGALTGSAPLTIVKAQYLPSDLGPMRNIEMAVGALKLE